VPVEDAWRFRRTVQKRHADNARVGSAERVLEAPFLPIHGAPDTARMQAADMVADLPKLCAARNGEGNYRRTCEAVGVQVGGSGRPIPGRPLISRFAEDRGGSSRSQSYPHALSRGNVV